MGRAQGFALIDIAFLSDPKFRLKLSRLLPDPDDYNSAVGAWLIALCAARRNGSPEIDVAAETGTRFAAQLLAAELVIGTGFPSEAFQRWAPRRRAQEETSPGGTARSSSAVRGPNGQFLPSQRVQRDAGDAGAAREGAPHGTAWSAAVHGRKSRRSQHVQRDAGDAGGNLPIESSVTLVDPADGIRFDRRGVENEEFPPPRKAADGLATVVGWMRPPFPGFRLSTWGGRPDEPAIPPEAAAPAEAARTGPALGTPATGRSRPARRGRSTAGE